MIPTTGPTLRSLARQLSCLQSPCVTLCGDKVSDLAVSIADGGNLPFHEKFGSVFAVIDSLTVKILTARQILLETFQYRLIGYAWE
jgi:hypothetical protein